MKNIHKAWFILLIGLFACNETNNNKPVPENVPERQYDRIKLVDLHNRPIDLKQYHGKTIFINFWATWCKPCIQEMPSIENIQNIMRNENIVFLMASSENAEEIDAFRKDNSFKFNYVRVENSEALNIQALPTTVIYNTEGKLVFSEIGNRKWDEENSIDLLRKTISTK
jgi:thiol-disulfide isomerase/thioredoxin